MMDFSTFEQTKRDHAEIAQTLRALPRLAPPQDLVSRLRVTASREVKRRRIHDTWDTWVAYHRERVGVWFNNAMRPFAVPAAGGLVTTVLFVCLMAAQYPIRAVAANGPKDTPVGEYVEAEFRNMGPISLDTEEVVVDLTIDSAGRIMDCELADDGIPIQHRDVLERQVKGALLYATFEPARRFGERMSGGKIRLAFRHSYIDVQG
jgi:hypothetical protein